MLLFTEAGLLVCSWFNLVIEMVWYGKYQLDLYGEKWHKKLWVDFLMSALIYISTWILLLSHLSNVGFIQMLHMTINFGDQNSTYFQDG